MLVTRPFRKDAKDYEEKSNARDGAKILWIRVIYQAVEDLSHPSQLVRVQAMSFLKGEDEALQDICYMIGLNASVFIKSFNNGKLLELKQQLRQKCL